MLCCYYVLMSGCSHYKHNVHLVSLFLLVILARPRWAVKWEILGTRLWTRLKECKNYINEKSQAVKIASTFISFLTNLKIKQTKIPKITANVFTLVYERLKWERQDFYFSKHSSKQPKREASLWNFLHFQFKSSFSKLTQVKREIEKYLWLITCIVLNKSVESFTSYPSIHVIKCSW